MCYVLLHCNTFSNDNSSSLPCAAPGDAAGLLSYINTYGSHPNQLIYKNAIFASTFAGDQCKFGQSSAPAGWKSQFINAAGSNKIYFVPAIFVDPATFSAWDGVINGAFNVCFIFMHPQVHSLTTSYTSGMAAGLSVLRPPQQIRILLPSELVYRTT